MIKQRIKRELNNGKTAKVFFSDGDKQTFYKIGSSTSDDNWINFEENGVDYLVNLNQVSMVEFQDKV